MHEKIVEQVLAQIPTRLAIIGPDDAGKTLAVENVIRDLRVQNHFSGRCFIISCDDAPTMEDVCHHIASDLGIGDVREDAISAILADIGGHKRTLLVLDKLDAIYMPTNPEQQEATEILLASLAAVDELTLIVTFSGPSLPDCVVWMTIGNIAPEIEGSLTTSLAESAVLSAATTEVHTESAVFHSISTGPRTIAQSKVPPARPTVFHGRDKEVERLVAHATSPNTEPLGIVGPGGIGKTTLSLKVLHDPRIKSHFAKERYFVSCEGAGSSDEVLSLLAIKLGVQPSRDIPLWPAVLEGLRARQRIFLILDNFESIWSPTDDALREASEVFLAQLSVLEELTLLVTTRGNHLPENFTWANVATAELDTLSSTAARMTFHDLSFLDPEVLASEVEENALAKLLREIDFMPLAITLLARLDDLPSSLLLEWLDHYTDVLEADYHDRTRRELSISVSIRISLAHLPPEGDLQRPRELLSVCGQLPVGLFPGVSTQLGSVIPNIGSSIQDLLRLSLVHHGGQGELMMLSPVRHYVSAHVPMSTGTQSTVDSIYMKLASNRPLFKPVRDKSPTAIAYDLELPNIVHILTAAVDRLSSDCHSEILFFGQYVMKSGLACLPLTQKLLPYLGDFHQAECLALISTFHERSGELQLAIEADMKACDLFEKLEPTVYGVVAHRKLAANLRELGRYNEASHHGAKAGLLERGLSLSWASPPPGENVSVTLQRYRDLRERHMLVDDVYSVDLISQSIFWIFNERLDDLGGQTEFIRELEHTLMIFESMEYWGNGRAVFMTALAHQYLTAARLDEAEHLLQEAYVILTGLNQPGSLSAVATKLGELHSLRGQFNAAIPMFEVAIRSVRETGWVQAVQPLEEKLELVRALALAQATQ